MTINLLERARQNRIKALSTLSEKEKNIFLIDDPRQDRTHRNNVAVFVSRRKSASTTYEQINKIAA